RREQRHQFAKGLAIEETRMQRFFGPILSLYAFRWIVVCFEHFPLRINVAILNKIISPVELAAMLAAQPPIAHFEQAEHISNSYAAGGQRVLGVEMFNFGGELLCL